MADPADETRMLKEANTSAGRQRLLGEIFMRHREWLTKMLELRLDVRVRWRVDPSDVPQETFIEAAARLDEHLKDPFVP